MIGAIHKRFVATSAQKVRVTRGFTQSLFDQKWSEGERVPQPSYAHFSHVSSSSKSQHGPFAPLGSPPPDSCRRQLSGWHRSATPDPLPKRTGSLIGERSSEWYGYGRTTATRCAVPCLTEVSSLDWRGQT